MQSDQLWGGWPSEHLETWNQSCDEVWSHEFLLVRSLHHPNITQSVSPKQEGRLERTSQVSKFKLYKICTGPVKSSLLTTLKKRLGYVCPKSACRSAAGAVRWGECMEWWKMVGSLVIYSSWDRSESQGIKSFALHLLLWHELIHFKVSRFPFGVCDQEMDTATKP